MYRIKVILKKCSWARNVYRHVLSIKCYVDAFICKFTLFVSPDLHCSLMHFIQGKDCPKVNIKTPVLFHEKIEWLKYYIYNNSNLATLSYDKNDVRSYVEYVGLGEILVPKIGVWSKIKDIPWDELPDGCIIKATRGWSNHVFCFAKKELDIQRAKKTLKKATRERFLLWTNGIKYAVKKPTKYICEELIEVEEGKKVPDDYKIYCFNGEPKYILFCFDRDKDAKYVFLDCEWNIRKDLRESSFDYCPERPENLSQMMDYARKLSKPFPFARIDLYSEKDKIYFGEITLTPSSAYNLYRGVGKKGLAELGDSIDLSHIDIDAIYVEMISKTKGGCYENWSETLVH